MDAEIVSTGDEYQEPEEQVEEELKKGERNIQIVNRGSPDTFYTLGLIGAWVYYIGRARNFGEGLAGFFKGFFWPAFVVYDLLKFLDRD